MKQSALGRFLLIGFLISLALGGISFSGLRRLNESSTTEVRRHMILFIAQTVESGPYANSVQDFHFRNGHRGGGVNLWVFGPRGELLAQNAEGPPPAEWNELKKPLTPHEFTFHYHPFHLIPDLTLVKLEAKGDAYLLIETRRQSSPQTALWIDIAFFLFVAGIAISTALVLIYFYLRKKSQEARSVLARLEKGDLKARFEIKQIDEIGSLMHDFNRMASEIERLVLRVQETETARKDLLAELSHDIRTPLTSLKTSIETLHDHIDEMPKAERMEFLEVSRAELTYFIHLVDDLFFIADLGEPRYKKTTQQINLMELLRSETRISALSRDGQLDWDVQLENIAAPDTVILGDPLLIRRLLKNVLDNASKHASTQVRLRISRSLQDPKQVLVQIIDDGPGITDDAIALFGQRRKQRFSLNTSLANADSSPGLSLGLGSVIMKTILELHGGSFRIARLEMGSGTEVLIALPRG